MDRNFSFNRSRVDMVKWIYVKTKFKAMIAYLSGAMEFADDEGSGWRKDLTKWLKSIYMSPADVEPVDELLDYS